MARLLLEVVRSRKSLPGVRPFLPRVPSRLVQQELDPGFPDQIQGLSPADRAAWEAELKASWVRTPAGPWLLTEENEAEAWPPMARGSGRFFLYAYGLTGAENEDELDLICHGNFPTEQDARETATRRQAQGEWRPVPGQVPPKPSRHGPLAPGR